MAPIAEALGIDAASDVQEVSRAVNDALGADGALPDLRQVIAALRTAAITEERLIVLFVDEVQELTNWKDPEEARFVESQLATLMDHPDGDVVLMLAGSDGKAIDALRMYGRPLRFEGLTFDLPPIAEEDWVAGLRERFRAIGVVMSRELILDVLGETKGHPLRTMTVCAQLQQLLQPGETVLPAFVIEAIAVARKQPSWNC